MITQATEFQRTKSLAYLAKGDSRVIFHNPGTFGLAVDTMMSTMKDQKSFPPYKKRSVSSETATYLKNMKALLPRLGLSGSFAGLDFLSAFGILIQVFKFGRSTTSLQLCERFSSMKCMKSTQGKCGGKKYLPYTITVRTNIKMKNDTRRI